MKKTLLFCISILASTNLLAQEDDGFEAIVKAGTADATTLMGLTLLRRWKALSTVCLEAGIIPQKCISL